MRFKVITVVHKVYYVLDTHYISLASASESVGARAQQAMEQQV